MLLHLLAYAHTSASHSSMNQEELLDQAFGQAMAFLFGLVLGIVFLLLVLIPLLNRLSSLLNRRRHKNYMLQLYALLLNCNGLQKN
jgi:hypothetical protein